MLIVKPSSSDLPNAIIVTTSSPKEIPSSPQPKMEENPPPSKHKDPLLHSLQLSPHARSVVSSLTAGALAGAVAKTVIAPLDRTKIYFQTHPEKRYRISGAIKFIRLTYEQTGLLSLWRGNSATMARILPYAAIQFMSHEQYKRLLGLNESSTKSPNFLHFVAGSLAGATGQCLTYPLDRARAVMAVTPIGRYKSLSDVFRKLIREEGGFRALYRGFAPTILGVIPYAGTSFFTFETLKRFWKDKAKKDGRKGGKPTTLQILCSGAFAGLLGQMTSYPLDIVRRRMQTSRQMGFSPEQYTSIVGTLRHVFRKEGIRRGWFKGVSMNFIKGPIATGISFTVYEFSKPVLVRIMNCK